MRRFKLLCVAVCLVAGVAVSTATRADVCYWPSPTGAVGYVIPITGYNAVLVYTYDPVGDIFAYTVDLNGHRNITFPDNSILPAYFYGQYQGNDPMSGKPIYDFYISGSGVQGSFAYCCTQVW